MQALVGVLEASVVAFVVSKSDWQRHAREACGCDEGALPVITPNAGEQEQISGQREEEASAPGSMPKMTESNCMDTAAGG